MADATVLSPFLVLRRQGLFLPLLLQVPLDAGTLLFSFDDNDAKDGDEDVTDEDGHNI